VRAGYLAVAAREPQRVRRIGALAPLADVERQLEAVLAGLTRGVA
jgi:thymidylate kinase